jgi:hypothetical protein
MLQEKLVKIRIHQYGHVLCTDDICIFFRDEKMKMSNDQGGDKGYTKENKLINKRCAGYL